MKKRRNLIHILWMGFLCLIACAIVEAQSITVTAPTAGNTGCIGGKYFIKWTCSGIGDPMVGIRLRNAATNTLVLNIANGVPKTPGFYQWTIPATVAPGNYLIRIRSTPDGVNNGDVYGDGKAFAISNCSQSSITVTSPAAGAEWKAGEIHAITWIKSGPMGDRVWINLGHTGSTMTIAQDASNSGSFQWSIPNVVTNGSFNLCVRTTDNLVGGCHLLKISGGPPDLVTCIEWDGKAAKVFKDKRIYFRVINRGKSQAGPSTLKVYIEKYGDHRLPIPALAPGQEFVCSIKKSWPTTGHKIIRATADCDNVVAELNENNNMIEEKLYVHALGGDEYTLEVKSCSDD